MNVIINAKAVLDLEELAANYAKEVIETYQMIVYAQLDSLKTQIYNVKNALPTASNALPKQYAPNAPPQLKTETEPKTYPTVNAKNSSPKTQKENVKVQVKLPYFYN